MLPNLCLLNPNFTISTDLGFFPESKYSFPHWLQASIVDWPGGVAGLLSREGIRSLESPDLWDLLVLHGTTAQEGATKSGTKYPDIKILIKEGR